MATVKEHEQMLDNLIDAYFQGKRMHLAQGYIEKLQEAIRRQDKAIQALERNEG